jgi:hypothetical protein
VGIKDGEKGNPTNNQNHEDTVNEHRFKQHLMSKLGEAGKTLLIGEAEGLVGG